MSRDFEHFSRRLDAEWRRDRLQALAPPPITPSEEAALLEELDRADPLGSSSPGAWLRGLRDAFRAWPTPLTFAAAACAILVVGFVVGRATTAPSGSRVAVGRTPPTPVEKPDYKPEGDLGALAIGAPVKLESVGKFREAMAFHNTAEFATKARPLLRESVALDARNDQAQFWLGITLLLDGKTAEAISPLEEAANLAPGSRLYKQYLVLAYLRNGDAANALRVQTDLMTRP